MRIVLKRTITAWLFAWLCFLHAKANNTIDTAYAALLKKIETAGSGTEINAFAAWTNEALKCAECKDALRMQLIAKLHDRNSIYSNRPYYMAARLKAYIIYQLAQTGLTEEAANIITGEMITAHDAVVIAASARALSAYIYKDTAIVPYLLKYLQPGFHDEWVDIAHIEMSYPLVSPTSVRLEVLKALQANALETTEVMDALNTIAFAAEGVYFYNDTLLATAARNAIINIEQEKSCCSKSADSSIIGSIWQLTENSFISPWIAAKQRTQYLPAGMQINTLSSRQTSFKKLRGKPLVMAFFYTRCSNPNKCSKTVTELGKLQQLLKQEALSDAVNTALVSYDPAYDSPERISAYALNRGLQMDEHTLAVNISEKYLQELLKSFDVEANYDGDIINMHEIQLLLFDKNNRFVRMYGQVTWNNNTLLEDIKRLAAE